MGKHTTTMVDRARDELFSHVIRCDVLQAEMDDRVDWLKETMDFMAHRYPNLSDLQLARLALMGARFIEPVIPHGGHATAENRGEWGAAPAI